jgi:hypothetical protein
MSDVWWSLGARTRLVRPSYGNFTLATVFNVSQRSHAGETWYFDQTPRKHIHCIRAISACCKGGAVGLKLCYRYVGLEAALSGASDRHDAAKSPRLIVDVSLCCKIGSPCRLIPSLMQGPVCPSLLSCQRACARSCMSAWGSQSAMSHHCGMTGLLRLG